MAQTGFTPIQLYSTSTAAAAPVAGNLTNSTLGSELAINITDGKLFYKDNANAVQVIGWKTVPTTAGGTGLTTYTAGDLSYYASGTTFTKLTIGTTGQILTSTGSAPQWTTLSGVAVTTFSAGTTGFTPNSATSGAITLAGTLITSNGGTGLSSYTAGDLAYYASGTALTKLAIGATGRFLSSTGSAPQWSAPAALTEVDDTNVTMTLGGTPSTALLSSVSMTLGWTGTLAVSRGGTGTGTAFTAGSVLFAGASGVYSQDNANFFWDDTNNRLGLGTASPSRQLHIAGAGTSNGIFLVNTAQTSGVDIELGSSDFRFQVRNNIPTVFLNNNAETMRIHASGGVSIGNTTDPGAGNLGVNGKIGVGVTPTYALQVSPGTYSDQLAVFNEAGTWTGNGGTVIADYYNATTMICGIKYSASTATSGFVTIHAGGTTERARFSPGGGMSIGTTTASPTNGILLPSNGILNTDGGTLYSTSIAGSTTGSGANMYIDAAGGFIQRSTSSIKYKTDIENLEPTRSSSIYEMRPVWYRSLCEMDRKDWSYYGLIAEEVAEIEPRLVFWGEKNEDGTQQAEGVMYDRLTVFLLAELQKQQKIIEQLKEKVGL